VIAVTDDGAENGEPVTGPERVGLGNTRARLEALYGPACRLELTRAEGRGACVTVRIPHRPRAAGPADEPSWVAGSEGG
jgi:sensor histidine kinase YesM